MAAAAGKRKTNAAAPVSAAKRTSGIDAAALISGVIRREADDEIAEINGRAAAKIAKASDVAARCAEIRAKADEAIARATEPRHTPEELAALERFNGMMLKRAIALARDKIRTAATNELWHVMHVVPPMLTWSFTVMCPSVAVHLCHESLANALTVHIARRYPVRAEVKYNDYENPDIETNPQARLRVRLYMFQLE